MSNIVVYAPMAQSKETDMESFYSMLDSAKALCKSQELIIIRGDLNAKVDMERHGI